MPLIINKSELPLEIYDIINKLYTYHRSPIKKDCIVTKINSQEILNFVCFYLDVSISEIFSRSRVSRIVEARHISTYLAKKITKDSHYKICKIIGNRRAPNVSITLKYMSNLIKVNKAYSNKIDEIEKALYEHYYVPNY